MLLGHAPHRVGHDAWTVVVCLSVCLSCTRPKSRTEGHRNLKIGRKEIHDTDDPFRGRKIKHLPGKGKILAPHGLCVLDGR